MKINENQKVTLTIGQLKKLVKESRSATAALEITMDRSYKIWNALYNLREANGTIRIFVEDGSESTFIFAGTKEHLLNFFNKYSDDFENPEELADELWSLDVGGIYEITEALRYIRIA